MCRFEWKYSVNYIKLENYASLALETLNKFWLTEKNTFDTRIDIEFGWVSTHIGLNQSYN